MAHKQHSPVVTIAALSGASGHEIAPRVADRLEVPLLDRAIPKIVAEESGLSTDEVASGDDAPRSLWTRLASNLGRASSVGSDAGRSQDLDLIQQKLRRRIEKFLAESARSGGVTVGRGGNVVLRTVPWALHVYLGGDRDARVKARMTQDGIDRETAEKRQESEDQARLDYVRQAYGVDGKDPALYHLMLDTTALDIDTCVDLIVTASRARSRDPRAGTST
jgi:hypothetical protein